MYWYYKQHVKIMKNIKCKCNISKYTNTVIFDRWFFAMFMKSPIISVFKISLVSFSFYLSTFSNFTLETA